MAVLAGVGVGAAATGNFLPCFRQSGEILKKWRLAECEQIPNICKYMAWSVCVFPVVIYYFEKHSAYF